MTNRRFLKRDTYPVACCGELHSNVFLRFFTVDDLGQHEKASKLFQEAEMGKVVLVTGPPVLFEVSWTLRKTYKLNKEQVLDTLDAIIACKGLKVTDADLVEDAINLAGHGGQEFADAYICASAREPGAEIATFNRKHFSRMKANLYTF